jgi:N-acetylglucosamine-6-sulfatase
MRLRLVTILAIVIGAAANVFAQGRAQPPSDVRRNVILILSDDHRYDFMGFHPNAPEWLETPSLDRMAAGGAHLVNAFVTTALCSPSRASILTGRYAHRHGVVDNQSAIREGTVFFPQYLQKAGYQTAYIGKWHMGEDHDSDRPRPGFDHWISFQGQGVYVNPTLNINGERRQVQGYTTDLLTESAVDWMKAQANAGGRPFFLYLSHKAVHAEFVPSERHRGRYTDAAIPYPPTMANTESNYRDRPRWVREQRYSWHGVDYMYHGQFDYDTFYRRYAETLLTLDEGVGRVLDFLDTSGLARNTVVIYMGDNGFLLGEHGLIDKRNAYEESMRVPMLAYAPGLIAAGSKVTTMVRNIDVAPTILAIAGVQSGHDMDGRSVVPALRGEPMNVEDELLYEYYWEYAFPHTPTTFALRSGRYKFIYYHGIWDLNEFYDLQTDPLEQRNLINVPSYAAEIKKMSGRLFDRLETTGGMQIPVRRGTYQAGERLVH